VALADDVVIEDLCFGLLREALVSGGNVVGFKLYGKIDFLGSGPTWGVMVRKRQGGVFVAAIAQPQNNDTVMLTVPVANTGQFSPLQPVSIGNLGRESRRVVVNKITPAPGGTYQLQLLPEGNEIFA
jgi:hypothetical protein